MTCELPVGDARCDKFAHLNDYRKLRYTKSSYLSQGSQRMYPEIMVVPMREELTRLGIKEARTAAEVDRSVAQPGTTMVVVNSVCGCAAGRMRPAVRLALQHSDRPTNAITVFAGQDREATDRARSYFTGYPPSSPSIGLLRDGKLVYMMQRSDIEQREAIDIASELKNAFEKFCGESTVSST
jgi:putative YphP/YqiW family bacilliredoxin